MRSGFVRIYDGWLKVSGQIGYNWSSSAAKFGADTGTDNSTAYHLGIDAAEVDSSFGPSGRWHAFSLRCLSIG